MNGWKVQIPDDPDAYPQSFCVVTSDWTPETDHERHYVAEGMTRETATLLARALNERKYVVKVAIGTDRIKGVQFMELCDAIAEVTGQLFPNAGAEIVGRVERLREDAVA